MREQIDQNLIAERSTISKLARDLVSIPAPNPPGNTTEISRYVEGFITACGLSVSRYQTDSDKPNILTHIGSFTGPQILLCAHMDTFPPPRVLTPDDSYIGKLDEGRIYGTAISDMRAGLAVVLTLGKILSRLEIESYGGVLLLLTSDEEQGGLKGAKVVMEHAAARRADYCLIPDQSGVTSVCAAEKGSCWIQIDTVADQGHAAYTEGRGAIPNLITAINAAGAVCHYQRQSKPPEDLTESELASRITMNIGTISGGVAVNLAAPSATAALDFRLPLGVTTHEVLEHLRSELSNAAVKASLTVLRASDPSDTPRDSAVVRKCVANAKRVTGENIVPEIRVGMSDARIFREAGIPTVVCGPFAHNFATVAEYVDEKEVFEVAQVIGRTVWDLLTQVDTG